MPIETIKTGYASRDSGGRVLLHDMTPALAPQAPPGAEVGVDSYPLLCPAGAPCGYSPGSTRSRVTGYPDAPHGRSPIWRADPHTHVPLANVPRPITTARMGEALCRRQDLHADAPLAVSRERSRTHAWAKPCLAGRPSALVRTQSPEQHTSRGRPSGMELPDYPVMATLPTPWDQDGPALPLPTGSFPVFVARSASRPVFSRIRISLRFPPFFLFKCSAEAVDLRVRRGRLRG
jgi:hypothetical protein